MRADSYAVKTNIPDCHQMFPSASRIPVSCMHQKRGDYSQMRGSAMVAWISTLPVFVEGLRCLGFSTSLRKTTTGKCIKWTECDFKKLTFICFVASLTYDVEIGSKPQQTPLPEEIYIMCCSDPPPANVHICTYTSLQLVICFSHSTGHWHTANSTYLSYFTSQCICVWEKRV